MQSGLVRSILITDHNEDIVAVVIKYQVSDSLTSSFRIFIKFCQSLLNVYLKIKSYHYLSCISLSGTRGILGEVSLHPPHIIKSNGSLTPSALIPFCAYQTNMTLLGQSTVDLPYDVCSKFQPTVLEGQVCYFLDLTMIEKEHTKVNIDNGLLLILDHGGNSHEDEKATENEKRIVSLNLKASNADKNLARVYIDTLAGFSGYRSGSYALSGLKKMTGTDSFMELTDESKKCQQTSFETCQTERYLDEMEKQCGCLPWSLTSAPRQKVGQILYQKVGQLLYLILVSSCSGSFYLFLQRLCLLQWPFNY